MSGWEKELELYLPSKTPDVEYAYIFKSDLEVHKCTKAELKSKLRNAELEFFATPETKTFILPGTDFFSLKFLIRSMKEELKGELFLFGFLTFIFSLPFVFKMFVEQKAISHCSFSLTFIILFVIPFLDKIYEYYCLCRINARNYIHEVQQTKFIYWIQLKKAPAVNFLLGAIVIIAIIQLITGFSDSIESAALVKPAVKSGEYWRLVSSTLMHGGLLHLFYNAFSLLALGKLMIRITNTWTFFTVFLCTGIIGSLFSVLFYPTQTSVGASGGIMGLIGFVLAVSIKQPEIPRKFYKTIIESIILTALLGILAYKFIDNGAHGGGLLAGLIFGLIFSYRNRNNLLPSKPSLLEKIFGLISIIILFVTSSSIIIMLINNFQL